MARFKSGSLCYSCTGRNFGTKQLYHITVFKFEFKSSTDNADVSLYKVISKRIWYLATNYMMRVSTY